MISCVLKDNRRLSHAFETTPFLNYFKHGLLLKIYNNRDHSPRKQPEPFLSRLELLTRRKKRPKRRGARRNDCFRRLLRPISKINLKERLKNFYLPSVLKRQLLGFIKNGINIHLNQAKTFPYQCIFLFITVIFQKTTYSVCWRCMSTYVFL